MRKIAVSKTQAAAKLARDRAEREGYDARCAGKTVGQNPYKSGPAWTGWRVGWYRANGRPDRLNVAGATPGASSVLADEID